MNPTVKLLSLIICLLTFISVIAGCSKMTSVPAESISIAEIGRELVLGEKYDLSAEISPEGADRKTVTWSSGDESVIRVDENGRVYAVGGGAAVITATAPNGSASTLEITVDGTRRIMKLQVNYPRQDDYNIGTEWKYLTQVNGVPVNGSWTVSVGDVLTLYAEFTEDDGKPDVGEATATYTVTESDFNNGFAVSMDLYVTENGGKNKGQSAHFIVTYLFSIDK